mmetsp:Transcript_12594/g.30853  ORF Transcript_12594/g.30853 Transcript_12594/m.30853 type:complete len:203 (+) Transcript_12594:576-1184(+)
MRLLSGSTLALKASSRNFSMSSLSALNSDMISLRALSFRSPIAPSSDASLDSLKASLRSSSAASNRVPTAPPLFSTNDTNSWYRASSTAGTPDLSSLPGCPAAHWPAKSRKKFWSSSAISSSDSFSAGTNTSGSMPPPSRTTRFLSVRKVLRSASMILRDENLDPSPNLKSLPCPLSASTAASRPTPPALYSLLWIQRPEGV